MATASSHSLGRLSFKVSGLCFSLFLTSCSALHSPSRKSNLAEPVAIGSGDVVGWLLPEIEDINKNTPHAVILFRQKGETKVRKIKLVEGEERLGMRLIDTAQHCYRVPMSLEDGPLGPGEYSSGVAMFTTDISLEVVGGTKRYLILRGVEQHLWEDTLPPAFYYRFGPLDGTQSGTQYRILPGNNQTPTITRRKP